MNNSSRNQNTKNKLPFKDGGLKTVADFYNEFAFRKIVKEF